MELRTTEESIAELSIRYESIRRSPIVLEASSSLSSTETAGKAVDEGSVIFPELLPAATTQDDNNNNTNNNNNLEKIPELADLAAVGDAIESLQDALLALHSKIERFRTRLKETDPVTGNPRYGEKTRMRVQTLVDRYTLMERHTIISIKGTERDDIQQKQQDGDDGDGDDEDTEMTTNSQHNNNNNNNNINTSTSIHILQTLLQKHTAQQQLSLQQQQFKAAQQKQREESARKAAEAEALRERLFQEEQARQELARKQKEEEVLHQQAQEARERRRQAQQAEQDWVDSIEKGPEGVKKQLKILKEGIMADNNTNNNTNDDYIVAITSLQTIFQQINAHPEEVKFRRIRRDHERFVQDIGRHDGGKELLLAAGFELGAIDDVPVYLSKEPDIEKDMDGWSEWFDLLKDTLDILNEAVEVATQKK